MAQWYRIHLPMQETQETLKGKGAAGDEMVR